MNATVFKNAQVVSPEGVFFGQVGVEAGRIAWVAPDEAGPRSFGLEALSPSARAPDVEDLEGDYLLPGLVESHTDHLERLLVPRPGVLWPTPLPAFLAHDVQMAAAGTTTVLNALCCGQFHMKSLRREILSGAVAALDEASSLGLCRSEHLLHLRCELADPLMPEYFAPYADHPRLCLVSLMDHTPGQRQFADPDQYRRFFQSRANWTDREFAEALPKLLDEQKRHAETHKAAIVAHCRAKGLPMATHDDATVRHVEQALADGAAVSEFPTSLEAARAARRGGMKILMGSPNVVRGASHTGNISALDLARAGLLDMLSSDYAPMSLMQAVFALSKIPELPLERAVAMASATPARVLGLHDRGAIAPELRADLVRVRLVDDWPVVRAVWREGEKVL